MVKRISTSAKQVQVKKINHISKVDSEQPFSRIHFTNILFNIYIYLCLICLNPLYLSASALRVCPAWSGCHSCSPSNLTISSSVSFCLFLFDFECIMITRTFIVWLMRYELGIEFYLFVSRGGMKRQRVHV